MPRLVFSVDPDGLRVEAVIGLDGTATVNLLAAGQPIPAPIRACGEFTLSRVGE
jgi:hypothetical protein